MAETKSVDELKKDADEKIAARAAREKYQREIQDALNSASTDVNVKIVLRHILNISGFNANPVVVNAASGEVVVSSSIYNGGRESVYHDLRKLMSAETMNAVERSE
jgi:hypothetical protein